jgi:crotonobetainyl-CoA:carnitine CoA-transferase CaiB-like acyl-CoA transferase
MPRLPLEGIRVVDVTVAWAGPSCSQLLAEWGAEVIRVEHVTRIQPMARYADRPSTREQQITLASQGYSGGGGYPDFEPGDQPWNRNASFNSNARNKLSMTADITTDEGRDIFYRLVEKSDVVVENNVPETIAKAKITYEDLRRVQPQIIMLRMPAFGLSGPYKEFRGLGTHIEGMIGHHYIRGYPDGTPDEAGEAFTGDAVGGVQGAFATMLALRHRRRTGEGQQIELAQAENFLPVLGEQILDWTMNGHDAGPQGNQHRSHAPHQAFPCLGEDQWIAIDVGTDAEFVALCGVLDAAELAADERFASAPSRWKNRTELDSLIGERTRNHDKFALFHELQGAGVAAGPLLDAEEKFHCPQLRERGFYEYLENSVVGGHWYPGLAWKTVQTENHLQRAPAMLGQDNEYVYKEVMGMSDDEYQQHVDSGMIADAYPPSVLGYTPPYTAPESGT